MRGQRASTRRRIMPRAPWDRNALPAPTRWRLEAIESAGWTLVHAEDASYVSTSDPNLSRRKEGSFRLEKAGSGGVLHADHVTLDGAINQAERIEQSTPAPSKPEGHETFYA